jgi:biopolymer transport protein ExbD
MRATPRSITEPLNLRSYIRTEPKLGWGLYSFIDLVIIVAMLFLNYSRFVTAPGIEVDLAVLESDGLQTSVGSAVLTVRRKDLLFFDGQKITPARLEEVLALYLESHPRDRALLIKVDRSTPTSELFAIFEAARKAGFDNVDIAAEAPAGERATGLLP